MPLAKSTVDVKILFDEREIITGPDGPVIRDIEQVPSGYRFALREIDESVKPGEEKVLGRQIGQGVKDIEVAKLKALRTQPPKRTKRTKQDALDNAPRKNTKRKKTTSEIDRGFASFFPNGIKADCNREATKFVDEVLVPFVKKVAQ